jgi:MFS transporter, CP family, cyanate transporter
LIDEIQDDLDASHALVGLLGTIPVLCMGLFAPVAAYLSARLGTRRAMTIGLVLIGTFGVLRALAPSAWLVVMLTWGVGVGMGIGNALAPLAVRETVPERPATGTGIYTAGIQIGATVSAAIAVPLAGLLGGWRGALIALSVSACVIAVVWAVLERGGEAHVRPERLVPRLPWRSRTAWLLVAIFATMASGYYGLNAWLADAYGERGWSDASAGLLLASMTLTAIPTSFLIPWLSDRRGGRRPWLVAVSSVFALAAIGFVALPAAGYAWALLAGCAQGGCFALVMTLPLDYERSRERVGALVGLMLGLGYSIAAVSPFVLGAVRDLTDSFDAVLWTCAAFLVAMTALVGLLPRPALVPAAD